MTTVRPVETPYLRNKKQTARYLGVSEGSVDRLMKKGLQYVKIGNLVRFRPEDLAAYLQRNLSGI